MFLKSITVLILANALLLNSANGEELRRNLAPQNESATKDTEANTNTEQGANAEMSDTTNNNLQNSEQAQDTEGEIIEENQTEDAEISRPIIEQKLKYKAYDYRSIMFSEEEMTKLIGTLEGRGTGTEGEEGEETISLMDAQRITTTVFLNSIMYLSPESWTIWVNEKKISNYEKDSGDLKIIKITSDEVKFMWVVRKTKWDIMMPNFNFSQSISKINKNNEVETIFTLKPNQSFLPETGEIVEGKIEIETPEPAEGEGAEGEIGEGGQPIEGEAQGQQ